MPEITIENNIIGKELQPGEIGCSLSHLKIYKKILKNRYRRTLILEDDIFVSLDAISKIRKAFRDLPENWEPMYLGNFENQDRMSFSAKFRIHFAYPVLNLLGYKKY